MAILKILLQILYYFAAEQKQNKMKKFNFITETGLNVSSMYLKESINLSVFNPGEKDDPPVPVPPNK